uniref:Uncharacterized protein n=1 Tax=Oryza nivara TaxID=4536 RepID=A0A0E0HT22_ORYNI
MPPGRLGPPAARDGIPDPSIAHALRQFASRQREPAGRLAAAAVTGDRREWGDDRASTARGVRARLARVQPSPRASWEARRRRDRRSTRLARVRLSGRGPVVPPRQGRRQAALPCHCDRGRVEAAGEALGRPALPLRPGAREAAGHRA